MPFDEDPTEENRSEPQFRQTAVSNVQARDIQIGQIVQKIVYLGIPPNSPLRPFALTISIALYLTLLIAGFVLLWRDGAGFVPLLLLIVGSVLLSLTCLYYAWFWKPEIQDKSALSSARQRSRQQIRRLAIVGFFLIPLLTCAGFFGWRSLPPNNILLLVANFDGPNQQNYQVTETLLRNLRNATEDYTDVKVQALNQTITEQQGSKVARVEGEQRKAAIVIWGEYGVTPTDVQISVHYELLKQPEIFPKLGEEVDGKAQTLAIAELNSFKLQTRLSSQMNYLTLFTLGMVQHAEKDYESAIARFSDALDQVKEPVPVLGQDTVYRYRGFSYFAKGDYKSAIADCNQALKLKPDNLIAYLIRGSVHNTQGNYTQAIADYTQYIKLLKLLEPLKLDLAASAYHRRGDIYVKQGNYTQAIADFNQALKLKPDHADAYYSRGEVYGKQGNDTQAVKDYTQALKLDPNNWAYNNRGNAYRRQGNYTQAIKDYNQALKLKPNLAQAYSNRGGAYYEQDKYTQAIKDYNQALKLKPDFADAYSGRGQTYYKQGNFIQAIADYTQALKLKPNYTVVYLNRGNAYRNQGNYTQAIADFDQALKLKPDYADAYYKRVDAYYRRGNSYYEQGNYTQAIADFNQALKLKPDNAGVYNNRGSAYLKQGNYTQAIADYTQALKLKPDLAVAYYNKARAYSLERKVKAAIESLRQAIDLDSKWRENAKTDSDFNNIRKDKQFQALVEK